MDQCVNGNIWLRAWSRPVKIDLFSSSSSSKSHTGEAQELKQQICEDFDTWQLKYDTQKGHINC